MKKGKEILTIVSILIFVAIVGVLVTFNGVKAHNNHYVRVEVNPKVEFITDANNNVISLMPINNEAKTLLVQEKFIGMKVYDACEKFVDLCAQANYIDVNGDDNAVRITVVSGLTQALENKVYSKINNYFKNNEIKAVVVESDNDIDLISEALDKNIASANKLMLINAVIEKDNTLNEKELNKLSETKLIDKLISLHKQNPYNSDDFTTEEITNKTKLIDFNRENFESHIERISNKSISEFQKTYDKHQAKYQDSYEENFNKEYNEWRNSKLVANN